jgi:hypothetical protein
MGKMFIEADPSTSTPFFPGLRAVRDDPLLGKQQPPDVKPTAANRDRRASRIDNLKHMEVLTAECAQMAGPAKPAGVSDVARLRFRRRLALASV